MQVLLVWLVVVALAIVGALLCGVGLLVAIPVGLLIEVYAYRKLTGGSVAPLRRSTGVSKMTDAQPPGQYLHILPREAYTPWHTRVVASLIDVSPVLLLTAVGLGFAILTGNNGCERESTEFGASLSCSSSFSPAGLIVFTVLDLAVLAVLVWNYGYRQGTTGASVGKSVMKFMVVSERTWQPVGFGQSLHPAVGARPRRGDLLSGLSVPDLGRQTADLRRQDHVDGLRARQRYCLKGRALTERAGATLRSTL